MSGEYAILLFHASSHAIRAEKLLKQVAIPSRLMPVPRQLSSDCGVCLRLTLENKEDALEIIAGSKITIASTHEI